MKEQMNSPRWILYMFFRSREKFLESSGGDPNALDSEEKKFLTNHIRKGTTGTYEFGGPRFQSFCKEYKVNAVLALLPLIVKLSATSPYWCVYAVVGTMLYTTSKQISHHRQQFYSYCWQTSPGI